jgi:hypothetical protein
MSHVSSTTIQRYIFKDDISPSEMSIWLIWKDTEKLDNATRDKELTAFKAELADVLNWETAQIRTKEGIIYT